MANIVFPPIETENPAQGHIEFEVTVDGNPVPCTIAYQALEDHFDAKFSDPLFAFMTGRRKIEEEVERRIRENRYENDGSIFLNSTDF